MSNEHSIKTFLKWAGNKSSVVNYIRPYMSGSKLIEPFSGSCAVSLKTQFDSYICNDLNPELINIYKLIQNDVDDFFLVYPGWKVHVRANADANSFLCDNTNGSTLVKFNSLAQNQASNFRVYYMGVEIIPSTGTATTLTW